MQPNPAYLYLPPEFWADVRCISQAVGYTVRGEGTIKVPAAAEISTRYQALGLDARHLTDGRSLTDLGERVVGYFEYRADRLNNYVRHQLMNADDARTEFDALVAKHEPTAPLPYNKQKGDKRQYALLTGMVNTLIEANKGDAPCDYDPKQLTAITRNGRPLRTLARRVDGAFPSATNPVALWEIKEYYYTTTFGSRVAGGVYETLLDGMELDELLEHTGIEVKHYLIIDAYRTWWTDGKSYLCRMVDMMHMGYVDEVLFGREVLDRVPALVEEWLELLPEAEARQANRPNASE